MVSGEFGGTELEHVDPGEGYNPSHHDAGWPRVLVDAYGKRKSVLPLPGADWFICCVCPDFPFQKLPQELEGGPFSEEEWAGIAGRIRYTACCYSNCSTSCLCPVYLASLGEFAFR